MGKFFDDHMLHADEMNRILDLQEAISDGLFDEGLGEIQYRDEICNIRSGMGHTPGKFEGEPLYIPVLWGLSLSVSYGEEVYSGDELYIVFDATGEEREFIKAIITTCSDDELSDILILNEDNYGFITHQWMSTDEYNEFVENL